MDALRLDNDLVGGWCQLPGSATAEILGSVGFDFVCIDTQHGLIGPDALLPMLQALSATGTPSLVRPPTADAHEIARALDRGAGGVIVPLVDSAAQAAAAVAACHYPPRGIRSYGPTRVTWQHRDALTGGACIVMIETAAGLAALDEIVEVDGLDAIFVGPSDLALNTGRPTSAQHGDPAYDAVLRSIAARCRDVGLPVGIFSASPEHVRRYRTLGFTFFALMSDAGMLRSAATDLLAHTR